MMERLEPTLLMERCSAGSRPANAEYAAICASESRFILAEFACARDKEPEP